MTEVFIASRSIPSAGLRRGPDKPFSAGLDWVAAPASTRSVVDAAKRRVGRISTELEAFIRAERLDGVEAEIVAAMQDLRELRIAVRGMRATARAERRA